MGFGSSVSASGACMGKCTVVPSRGSGGSPSKSSGDFDGGPPDPREGRIRQNHQMRPSQGSGGSGRKNLGSGAGRCPPPILPSRIPVRVAPPGSSTGVALNRGPDPRQGWLGIEAPILDRGGSESRPGRGSGGSAVFVKFTQEKRRQGVTELAAHPPHPSHPHPSHQG